MNDFSGFSVVDWLSYLENRHPKEIQLGLTRIKKVACGLDLLDLAEVVITVAGTNGKGSTVAVLEAIYQAAGYQVGTYTSPHLLVFNERIRLNGQPISDIDLCQALTYIEQGRGQTPLTYFETATLAAFWYFKHKRPDVVILEVGMGGRLDATNVIDPDLAIITTIAMDHQQYLGHDKETIGFEKAGILRPDIPFIYADSTPPKSIVKHAESLHAKQYVLNEHYSFECLSATKMQIIFQGNRWEPVSKPALHPQMVAAAIMGSYLLNERLPVNHAHRQAAMQSVMLAGRQQMIAGRICTILDVAHNPQAVELLAEFVKKKRGKGAVHAVFSALHDKDFYGLIKPMQPIVEQWYPALLHANRAASESLLQEAFSNILCSRPVCYQSAYQAYDAALNQAKTGDVIVVYGSFLTVGGILSELQNIRQEKQSEV